MLSQTLTPETHVRKRKPVTRNVWAKQSN
jgi:hypothetical protein